MVIANFELLCNELNMQLSLLCNVPIVQLSPLEGILMCN